MEIKTQDSKIRKQKFTKSDERFLSLLEDDGNLSDIVDILRIRANLPRNGIAIAPQVMKTSLKRIEFNQLWYASSYLLSLYKLPPSWRITMMSILMFGIAVPPVHVDAVAYKQGQAGIALENEVHLVIRERITRTDLRDYFLLHPELDKALESLPEHKKIGKSKITSIGKQIYRLKQSSKTYDQIVKALPFGEEDDNFDQSKVGVYLHRYMRAIRQHITIDPHHRVLKAIEL